MVEKLWLTALDQERSGGRDPSTTDPEKAVIELSRLFLHPPDEPAK
jgi:hypothetical protein